MHERLRRVEDRLVRLVASGWRTAAGEAAELGAEASELAENGLPHLAERLQAVAAAKDPAAALQAVALALSAVRMLRVRLAADAPPPGAWAPLQGTAPRPDRLLPVARLALGDGEVWACVKLRGSQPEFLVLLDPPDLDATGAWLRRPLLGHLRWQSRYPLGGGGEVERCALEGARWDKMPDEADDPLWVAREVIRSGKLKDGKPLFQQGGNLRAQAVDPEEAMGYVWPDSAPLPLLRAAGIGMSLAWRDGALVMPLALVSSGGDLLHLVPGLPAEAI